MDQQEQDNLKKTLTVVQGYGLRKIVDTVNNLGIQKEDIVNILRSDDEYFLLYYK